MFLVLRFADSQDHLKPGYKRRPSGFLQFEIDRIALQCDILVQPVQIVDLGPHGFLHPAADGFPVPQGQLFPDVGGQAAFRMEDVVEHAFDVVINSRPDQGLGDAGPVVGVFLDVMSVFPVKCLFVSGCGFEIPVARIPLQVFCLHFMGLDGERVGLPVPFPVDPDFQGPPGAGIGGDGGGFDIVEDVVVRRHMHGDVVDVAVPGQHGDRAGVRQRVRHVFPVRNPDVVHEPGGFLLGRAVVRNQRVMGHDQHQVVPLPGGKGLVHRPPQQVVGHVSGGLLGFVIVMGIPLFGTVDRGVQHDQRHAVGNIRRVGKASVVTHHVGIVPGGLVVAAGSARPVVVLPVSQAVAEGAPEVAGLDAGSGFRAAGGKIGGVGVVHIVVAVHHIDSGIPESLLRLQVPQLPRQRFRPAQFAVARHVAGEQQRVRIQPARLAEGRVQEHVVLVHQAQLGLGGVVQGVARFVMIVEGRKVKVRHDGEADRPARVLRRSGAGRQEGGHHHQGQEDSQDSFHRSSPLHALINASLSPK